MLAVLKVLSVLAARKNALFPHLRLAPRLDLRLVDLGLVQVLVGFREFHRSGLAEESVGCVSAFVFLLFRGGVFSVKVLLLTKGVAELGGGKLVAVLVLAFLS